MTIITSLLLCLISSSTSNALAADKIQILGGSIPYVLHDQFPGPHNYIFHTIIANIEKGSTERTMLPYTRALRNFQAHQADCLYATTTNPAYFEQSLVASGKLLFSQPVNTIKLRAFSRAGKPVIHSWEDLKGKTIVGTKNQLRGIRNKLPTSATTFITVFNAAKAFDLLEKNRAAVAMVYGMDAHLTAPNKIAAFGNNVENGKPLFVYDRNFAPFGWGEVLACWNTPKTARFLDAFNARILSLRNSGRLQKLFAPVSR